MAEGARGYTEAGRGRGCAEAEKRGVFTEAGGSCTEAERGVGCTEAERDRVCTEAEGVGVSLLRPYSLLSENSPVLPFLISAERRFPCLYHHFKNKFPVNMKNERHITPSFPFWEKYILQLLKGNN